MTAVGAEDCAQRARRVLYGSSMIRRIYLHNFRCLENFELSLDGFSSALLIGRNGSGKTSVGTALEVLQKIARGTNRVGDLVRPSDLTRGRTEVPMRFEIEMVLAGKTYTYVVAFEFPGGFRELRVSEEKLVVDGQPIFSRELAEVRSCVRVEARTPPFGSTGTSLLYRSVSNFQWTIQFLFSSNGSRTR